MRTSRAEARAIRSSAGGGAQTAARRFPPSGRSETRSPTASGSKNLGRRRASHLVFGLRVLSRGRGRALAYRSATPRFGPPPSDAAGQRLARNPLPRATRNPSVLVVPPANGA